MPSETNSGGSFSIFELSGAIVHNTFRKHLNRITKSQICSNSFGLFEGATQRNRSREKFQVGNLRKSFTRHLRKRLFGNFGATVRENFSALRQPLTTIDLKDNSFGEKIHFFSPVSETAFERKFSNFVVQLSGAVLQNSSREIY